MIDSRNSTSSDISDFNMINEFATTNGVVPGSDVIVISQSQIVDPGTTSLYTYSTEQVYQVPFNYEEVGNLSISVNPNLGLLPEPIKYNIYNSTNLTLEENGAVSVALNNNNSFIWIRNNQGKFKNTLNSLQINYGIRKD